MIDVSVDLKLEGSSLPSYSSFGASGFDIRSVEEVILPVDNNWASGYFAQMVKING